MNRPGESGDSEPPGWFTAKWVFAEVPGFDDPWLPQNRGAPQDDSGSRSNGYWILIQKR